MQTVANAEPIVTDLPAPCVQAHAANLAWLPAQPGRAPQLACVWFGGSMEGRADICVYSAQLCAHGAWSAAQQLSADPLRSEQNPILFAAPGGQLWLLHTAQTAGQQDRAVVRRRISQDGGASWGDPHTLFGQPGTFVRQPPVVAADGAVLIPIFRCVMAPGQPGQTWDGSHDTSAVMRSADGGQTWSEQAVPASTGLVHMCLVPGAQAGNEVGNGHWLAFFRSRFADHIYASASADHGQTWAAPWPTVLPNNNSSIQTLRLADGRLAVVFNHSSAAVAKERRASLYDDLEPGSAGANGKSSGAAAHSQQAATAPTPSQRLGAARQAFWGAPRAPLSIALSDDEGRTWPWLRHLQEGDGYCMTNNSAQGLNRELSYPSVVQAANGDLHVAYTHHRRFIRHAQVPLAWLENTGLRSTP